MDKVKPPHPCPFQNIPSIVARSDRVCMIEKNTCSKGLAGRISSNYCKPPPKKKAKNKNIK